MLFRYSLIMMAFFSLLAGSSLYAGERGDLAEIKSAYEAGEKEKVLSLGSAFDEHYSSGVRLAEVLAMLADMTDDFDDKVVILKRLQKEYKGSLFAAKAHLDLGEVLLLKGDSKGAMEEFSVIAEDHGDAPFFKRALYLLALANLDEGNYSRARINFRKVGNLSSDQKMQELSEIGIADTFFLSGDLVEAADEYEALIAKYPSSSNLPKMMLNLGRSIFRQGKEKEGLEIIELILAQYPGSVWALAASKELNRAEDYSPGRSGSAYYLQVGVFSTIEGAELYKGKLLAMGLETSIRPSSVYKVVLGPFGDDIEAKIYSETLKREKDIDSFVIEE